MNWKKKFKGDPERGGAFIYTHPLLSRAIVENHNGIKYNGLSFKSIQEAKEYAESVFK